MARRPTSKSESTKVEKPRPVPNLPQHNLPEPFASLQTVGFDIDLDLYLDISDTDDPDKIKATIETLVRMAEDATYYSYSNPESLGEPDARCFAPLNALRALAYFDEDIAPFISRIIPMFASEDDALREELPILFSCIGDDAVEPLLAVLSDPDADINLRDGAAESRSLEWLGIEKVLVIGERRGKTGDVEIGSHHVGDFQRAGDVLPIEVTRCVGIGVHTLKLDHRRT